MNKDVFDINSSVSATYAYGPFGETVSHTGRDSEHRFSTKPWDETLGTYTYICRDYSPGLGRWLSEDPILERGGYNFYAYCGNEPVGRYDVLGCWAWHECELGQMRIDRIEVKMLPVTMHNLVNLDKYKNALSSLSLFQVLADMTSVYGASSFETVLNIQQLLTGKISTIDMPNEKERAYKLIADFKNWFTKESAIEIEAKLYYAKCQCVKKLFFTRRRFVKQAEPKTDRDVTEYDWGVAEQEMTRIYKKVTSEVFRQYEAECKEEFKKWRK